MGDKTQEDRRNYEERKEGISRGSDDGLGSCSIREAGEEWQTLEIGVGRRNKNKGEMGQKKEGMGGDNVGGLADDSAQSY